MIQSFLRKLEVRSMPKKTSLTQNSRNGKRLKKMLLCLLIILVILSIIPYVIPLSKYTPPTLPFENSFFYQIEETRLHYRLYLPEQDHSLGNIIMVHGLGGSTFSYEKNAPFLASMGYRVITLDLPGFGYSSRNVDENHAQEHRAELIWQLLDDIDPSASWHLMGHSMGGGTVAAMAYQNPDKTDSLVLIDGALFNSDRGSSWMTTFPVVGRWIQVSLEHILIKESRIETFLASAYGQEATQEQVQGYLLPLQVKGTARAATSFLKTSQNLSEDELSKIKVPVLAIWGEDDTWVPLSDAIRIKVLMPQMEIVSIDGSGHCPMETHAEIFNDTLRQWLIKKN